LKRLFFFSKHYSEDKEIDTTLAIDCIETGKKHLDEKPNKFRKGELIVVWKNRNEKCFVITAYWNVRRQKNA